MVNLHSKFISCRDEANVSRVAGEASMSSLFLKSWSKSVVCISYISVDSLFHLGFTDHFDHIKKVIGAESIGIGGDFEGAVR